MASLFYACRFPPHTKNPCGSGELYNWVHNGWMWDNTRHF